MKLRDKVIVITGGANGIGAAMARRFAQESPRGIVIADIDTDAAAAVAEQIGGIAHAADVAVDRDVQELVARTREVYGPIDLFCSNAGIELVGGPEVPDETWQKIYQINFMAHVYAARAVVPEMQARKTGYLLQTVSAAGLLTTIGSAPYSVTKHAALSFAEWLSITYGNSGIGVSALCPQGVKTRMLLGADGKRQSFLRDEALEPEQVADIVVDGLDAERFLILPHPEVGEYFRRKANDYDRWLRGMRRLHARAKADFEKWSSS